MSDLKDSLDEVRRAVEKLSLAIDLQEKMEKEKAGRITKAGKKVDALRNSGKFVRFKDGKELYGIGLHKFTDMAKDAGAVYKLNGVCLVNVEIFDKYLETFKL